MADRILPHLGIIASALPHIWATASSHLTSPKSLTNSGSPNRPPPAAATPSSSDTGAVVRLHSALIAVLTHLVGKLRAVALRDTQVAGVIFPLLNFSTSLGESEKGDCFRGLSGSVVIAVQSYFPLSPSPCHPVRVVYASSRFSGE